MIFGKKLKLLFSHLRREPAWCQCGGNSPYDPDESKRAGERVCPRYLCVGCLRRVPFCSGGSDSILCDDCWCLVTDFGKKDVPRHWAS